VFSASDFYDGNDHQICESAAITESSKFEFMSNPSKQAPQKKLKLLSGRAIPMLGQGTWLMGEDPAKRKAELAAIRTGLDLGLNLIDTAEMYAEGEAEKIVGEAMKGRRDEVFLVSKVLPHNASLRGTVEACKRSLKRLGTDYLDIYLFHWRGRIPLVETLEAFLYLKQSGMILDYGVSNFDVDDMLEAVDLPGGDQIVTNQVLYNLVHRGIEWDLLSWSRKNRMAIMAYSPIGHSSSEQKDMSRNRLLKQISTEHGVTWAQVAIAWLLHQQVVAIPKATTISHIRENHDALNIKLTRGDLSRLDEAFPPPKRKIPLEMI